MYFYLGYAVLLYFAFILFPWWFSHGLARATATGSWLLTPALHLNFDQQTVVKVTLLTSWKAATALKPPCHEEVQVNHTERPHENRDAQPALGPGTQLRTRHMSEDLMLDIHLSWTFRRLQPHPTTDCNWVRTTQLSPVHPQNWKSGINCGFKSLTFGVACSAEIEKSVPGHWCCQENKTTKQKKLDKTKHKTWKCGTSLVAQWLRFLAPNAGGPGSIPGGGTRFHMPQPRVYTPWPKISHASTKIKDPVCCN